MSFSDKPERKKIVVCFDGKVPHGGLVDRLKGIISFYEISKILGFEFKILFNHPFKLTDFLEPNAVNWNIKEEELKYSLFSSRILYLMNNFNANPLELIRKSKAKIFFVYANVDYLSVLYPHKNKEELEEIWRNNYNALFKTSVYLNNKLMLNTIESRIVFHTRFTTLMGDFADTTKLVLNENEKKLLIGKVVNCIDNEAKLYADGVIYIVSDSEYFLQHIKQNTVYKTLNGLPKHLENNNRNSDYHAKTFIDFYFIAQSDNVVLIQTDKMYNSAFSKYASILGNKPFKKITD
ncbi:hypothetical protein [Flavobacterium sp. RS13.1]|uniref:hypothetical protein n=1 Tax=Flavobacterium sp. RS13.1 TaxID=3400345 RepID=UPI003AB05D2D